MYNFGIESRRRRSGVDSSLERRNQTIRPQTQLCEISLQVRPAWPGDDRAAHCFPPRGAENSCRRTRRDDGISEARFYIATEEARISKKGKLLLPTELA